MACFWRGYGSLSQSQREIVMKNMLVHDLQLTGRSPSGMAQNTFDVPKGMGTAHVLGWIGNYASSVGGLDNLFIMCHGYEHGIEDPNAQVSTYALGYGLALGDPGLTFDNLRLTGAWSGKVGTITLFACGPANTRPGYQNTSGDGMRFCGELALISGADVIAAVETQIYYMYPSWWDALVGNAGVIDFGDWEGSVYRFSADDGTAERIGGGPSAGASCRISV
jgi:hypothetical protein